MSLQGLAMSIEPSCRTCQHCCLGQASNDGWCRLRQIRINADIALFAVCHHWTKRSPSLPRIKGQLIDETLMDRQLEFDRELAVKDV